MNSQAPQPVVSFLAHEDGTTSASFSPDGTTLATGGYDCAVRLWDVNTWHGGRTLPGHRRGHVAFAPDGRHLVSGGLHKDTDVFDTSTWRVVETLNDTGGVWALAFRPDGSQIVLVEPSEHSDGRSHRPLEFWDTHSWAMLGTADVGTNHVYGVAFSPDGRLAAISNHPNGSVSIWGADFTQRRASFPAHDMSTWGLSFSPDGKTLATGGADNVVRLWDTASWEVRHQLPHEEMRTLVAYKNSVLCTAFSPDGDLLITGGLDGVLTVWRLET